MTHGSIFQAMLSATIRMGGGHTINPGGGFRLPLESKLNSIVPPVEPNVPPGDDHVTDDLTFRKSDAARCVNQPFNVSST
jgi:hypothetical protein